MRPLRVLPALGLLLLLAAPAAAQDVGAGYSWVLRGVEFSACVEFLLDPGFAAEQMGTGFVAVPAARFELLSPILRREIQGDTVLAAWIPSQVCTLEAPAISADGRVLLPEKKMGPREVIGYWVIAGNRNGAPLERNQWFAANFWTNDWQVRKLVQAAYIPADVFKVKLTAVPESNRHNYEIAIGKTTLSWDGVLVGRDSASAEPSVPGHLAFNGGRGIRWNAEVVAPQVWTRLLPGTFRVSGKDDLAKALKGSPIRNFGPMEWGGDARIEFSRSAAH